MRDEAAWVLPAFGSRSFDLLPDTIERLFTGSGGGVVLDAPVLDRTYDHVVLVYLDAFGWRFAERHGEHPLLRGADAVERLTSQFPSTTTVHTPTIHSGLSVAEHGLYEWHVYEPSLDRMITPLPFCFAGDEVRDSLLDVGLRAETVFPAASLYERLAKHGVVSHVSQHAEIARSAASSYLLRGAVVHPFRTSSAGIAALGAALAAEERAYGYLYLAEVDALMHHVGPDDDAVAALFDVTLTAIDVAVRRGVFPDGTLVLVTADHGMAAVSPERTSYVNVVWPEIADHLRIGADGKPLAPAGSCRDLFLHVRPGEVEHVVEELASRLEDVADVVAVERLIELGAFGEPSATLRSRLADVVCLPHPDEAVYWLEPGRFEQHFRGQHGGLTAAEMEIPLVALVTG